MGTLYPALMVAEGILLDQPKGVRKTTNVLENLPIIKQDLHHEVNSF